MGDKYDRLIKWERFNTQVERHITAYTLVQYGNPEGDEQVDEFTVEDCWKNIQRYYNRRNSNTRGDIERLRDVIKVAHYASFIYGKLKAEMDAGEVYKE